MPSEWYLLNGPKDIISGFEGDALFDFGPSSFLELLETEIADDIEICNYDLSECVKAKAIVQNNLQDTKLKTLSRAILVPIGTCKAGMYVKYKDKYWLIVSLVDDNKVYEKAIALICNYKLDWLGSNGKPVRRWVHIESASQYNNGETNAKNYFIRTDQVMIYMPDDDESLLINSGLRFVIDRRCEIYERSFDPDTICNTEKPIVCYDVTRTDSVLYSYQGSGHFQLLATQDEQRIDDGYYCIDGTGYWLCKKPDAQSSSNGIVASIKSDADVIYVGIEAGEFVGEFYDESGAKIDLQPVWSIDSDLEDRLEIQEAGNSILIYTDDESLAAKSFTLSLSAENVNPVTKTVNIKLFM